MIVFCSLPVVVWNEGMKIVPVSVIVRGLAISHRRVSEEEEKRKLVKLPPKIDLVLLQWCFLKQFACILKQAFIEMLTTY